MISILKVLNYLILGLCLVVGPLCSWIVLKYLRHKPLGMQTFLDHSLIEVARTFMIYGTTYFFSITAGQETFQGLYK